MLEALKLKYDASDILRQATQGLALGYQGQPLLVLDEPRVSAAHKSG